MFFLHSLGRFDLIDRRERECGRRMGRGLQMVEAGRVE
jgi:hypothetical protein